MKKQGHFSKDRFVEYTFLLLLFVMPFFGFLAPIALGLFVLCAIGVDNWKEFYPKLRDNLGLILFIIFYLLVLVGLFYSHELGIKYSRIGSQLPFLMVPLALIKSGIGSNTIIKAKRVFVGAVSIFCLIAFVSLIYNGLVNFEHRLNYNFIQRSMYHFHYPYDVLYLNIAYVFLLTEHTLKRYREWVISIFFIFLFLSGVRIGIFTFLLISLIFVIKNYKKLLNTRFLLKTSVLVALALLALNTSKYAKDKLMDTLSTIGFKTEKYVSDVGKDYHKISLRTKLWISSYDLIKSRPILGFGPNGSQQLLEEKYKELEYNGLEGLNSHNQFLTTTLNHGLLGLLVLTSIFITAICRAVKQKNIQFVLCIIVFLLAFATESILVRQKGVFLFVIIVGLLLLEARPRTLK